MTVSYVTFKEDILVRAAEIHQKISVRSIPLELLIDDLPYEVTLAWEQQVIGDLRADGFVEDDSVLSTRRLLVTGPGFAEVDRISERRKPISLSDRLASDKFQKIGSLSVSFLSFLVSIGALIVALIALTKAP